MNRLQLWSCGGGRQSAGIAAFIVQGKLPKPDHVCMAALEWEKRTTWDYVTKYIRPAMRELGIPFTIIPRKKYSRPGMFWESEAGDTTLLLPAHTNLSGNASKLPELCSDKWKREVITRWANEQECWKERGVDCWIGISQDEKHRRRGQRRKWWNPVYPLLDMLPKMTGVSSCLQAVAEVGWPQPPRSRCTHCPNQADAEWLELTPAELAKVCDLEDEIRKVDPHAFFHKKLVPLRQVEFDREQDSGGLFGGCSAGMCY